MENSLYNLGLYKSRDCLSWSLQALNAMGLDVSLNWKKSSEHMTWYIYKKQQIVVVFA